MSAVAELAKLQRAIAELSAALAGRGPRGDTDRRALKSEIEACMQDLDELRNRI
ncbi:hypothetical protein [Pelagibacterium montanilacus]|uniref:hypothetical protein n=1 Tax=Pelagibacterium montanilacus TaxID=2185280 RepID=UPI0013E0D6FD|nr:hypothetical protein [Pelagibacterium montanilacus]